MLSRVVPLPNSTEELDSSSSSQVMSFKVSTYVTKPCGFKYLLFYNTVWLGVAIQKRTERTSAITGQPKRWFDTAQPTVNL